MKKVILAISIIGAIILAQHAIASDQEREADHQALRMLKDTLENAINEGDLQQVKSCLADDYTLIVSDQTIITEWEDFEKYWNSMFNSKDSPVKSMKCSLTANILTQFLSSDLGYCHGTNRDIYTLKNKRKIALESTWSAILQKEADIWKIKTAHVGVNFMENPVTEIRSMSWFTRLAVAMHLKKMPGEVDE